MADAALRPVKRPEDYRPPKFEEVETVLKTLKALRQPVIDRIWEGKRVRRRQWDDVLRKIPKAYRQMLVEADAPEFEDSLRRLAGLVTKHEPVFDVIPPSGRGPDVSKASKEELRLNSVRMQIADQQDRDPYAMGVDSQIANGESWLLVMPDPSAFDEDAYKRGEDEEPDDYKERYAMLMADGGIPIRITDCEPQTVYPFFGDNERLQVSVLESEHQPLDIRLGYGYHPVKGADGKVAEWMKRGAALSAPFVAADARGGSTAGVVDTTHDRGDSSQPGVEKTVRKVIYLDCWCYQMYLDGVLVEEWEHNFGIVPLFPAMGPQTSDRDPGYQSSGLLDPLVRIIRLKIMFAAILQSNALQHGFPTAMLKNPEHGLVHPITGEPLSRTINLGEMNLIGTNEVLEFPFLAANMSPDFMKYMEYLDGQIDDASITNLSRAVGTEMAGYAMAQVRSMQMAVLSPVYTNVCRQWRKIGYFVRHLIENVYPSGIWLRGAVEEAEDGTQYRAIVKYGKEHCTRFTINCRVDEGIKQDEMAERKSAIEMHQAGLWSKRRAMERTGVEDPESEAKEIDTDRVISSPASDEVVLRMATQIATERYQATRQEQSSPFYQALEQAKQTYMGGAGQFQNQGGEPVNALPGGQPMQQNPAPTTPQQGGPMAGPPAEGIDMRGLGTPQTPGGVPGGNVPAGAPG